MSKNMNLISAIIKMVLNFIGWILIKSPSSIKYLYNYPLKNEIENYIENIYYKEYRHLDNAIRLEKKYYNKANAIYLDIGGADGKTATIFRKSYPQNKIYVFEPLEENLIKLTKLGENLAIIPKAVGSISGTIKINKAKRITSSSIFFLEKNEKSKIFSDSLEVEEIKEVEITTIDETVPLNTNIGILKIDVQGYELEVLKGAVNSLNNTFCIVVELNNHEYYKGSPKYYELDEFLRNSNFILYDILPSTKEDTKLIEWDSIYLNSKYL